MIQQKFVVQVEIGYHARAGERDREREGELDREVGVRVGDQE